MWALFSALVLSATPKMAATPFVTVGLPAERGELLAEHFATRLLEQGLQITTPRDIATVVGLERQKELLSCSDGSLCVAELAGALGVTEIVTGDVAKLDVGYQVVVKVLEAKSGRARFAKTARVDSEKELFEMLDAWAPLVAGKAPPRNWTPIIPVVAGAISGGVGAGFMASSNASLLQLQQRGGMALSYEQAVTSRDQGSRDQAIGVGLVAGGGAAMIAGLVWLIVSTPSAPPTAMVVPSPNGLAIVGVWP